MVRKAVSVMFLRALRIFVCIVCIVFMICCGSGVGDAEPSPVNGEVAVVASSDEFLSMEARLEAKLEDIRRILGSGGITRAILDSPALLGFSSDSSEVEKSPGNLPPVLHVLLLGLDRRMNWDKSHADAIHLFSFDTQDPRVTVTSIPRGSRIGRHQGGYIAQAYWYGGRKLIRQVIGDYLGLKIDYVVEVNFSTAMRLLELAGYRGEEALRFLRHRKSYGGGDVQRSRNQQAFLLRQFSRVLPFLRGPGGEMLFRAGWRLVETDMPAWTARRLLAFLLESGFDRHPERITAVVKPARLSTNEQEIPEPGDMGEAAEERYRKIGSEKDKSRKFSMQAHIASLCDQAEDQTAARVYDLLNPVIEKKLIYQVGGFSMRKKLHSRLSSLLAAACRELGRETSAHQVEREYQDTWALLSLRQLPDPITGQTAEVEVDPDIEGVGDKSEGLGVRD